MRHPARLGLAQAVRSGLEQTDGDLVLVGDEQHGMRPDDLRRLWHSYAEQPAAEQQSDNQNSDMHTTAARARWFEKMLAWKPTRTASADRYSSARPRSVEPGTSRRWKLPAASSGGLDDRENGAARRAVVHPLYLEQRRRMADQPAADRQPPGFGSVDRRLGSIAARSIAARRASTRRQFLPSENEPLGGGHFRWRRTRCRSFHGEWSSLYRMSAAGFDPRPRLRLSTKLPREAGFRAMGRNRIRIRA